MRGYRREILLVLLLAAAPVLAYAPAWRVGRLLAPGEGVALHLPLRVEVFRAYARGELPSWNPSAFSGAPLLASYRPGALHPLMPALAGLPPFAAFQTLVLVSLALAGPLTYAYARRLGAGAAGGIVAGLSFVLGPYLVRELGDSATLVAAPALVLALLALEAHLARGGATRATALAASVALLLLAGSPQACVAGSLLAATRLGVAALARREPQASDTLAPGHAGARSIAAALAAGLLLAAPQLLPTLEAWRASGPGGTGAAALGSGAFSGVAGLVVRSVSHTPAAIFALAAVPLVPAWPGLRRSLALGVAATLALAACGQLDGPGPLALALDFALAVVAGLSLSAQWRTRREARGRRLRLLAAISALCAATALSIATTVTGPLDPFLAAPVGLLALGLILYFALAEARSPVVAHAFLLPLAASFLLQPWGRHAWAGAPTARELEEGTATRQAIDAAMGPRHGERTLPLLESWPDPKTAADLAWANLASFADRRNANGYDPLAPDSRRRAFEGMRVDGSVPRALLESDPGRLEFLGVRWLQLPTASLATAADADGLGDEIDVVVEEPRPHLFAVPFTRATEVRIVSFLAGAAGVEQGRIVAECVARLANGREIWVPIRAGVDTAEWAWERPDVRTIVRHRMPEIYRSSPAREGFPAHQYRGVLRLPGRFAVTALRFRTWPGAPAFWLLRAGLHDALSGRSVGISLASAHASDEVRLAQAADTPLVSLFEVRRGIGPAWVVESLRRLPDERRVLDFLRSPTRLGIDARREALATEADSAGLVLPADSRSSAADVARAVGGRIVVRAAGPGLLVIGEGYDRGWTARVDAAPARIVRANADRMALALGPGTHRVVLRHRARGLVGGALVASAALAGLAGWRWREGRLRGLTRFDAAC
jgi:hypothetical protein